MPMEVNYKAALRHIALFFIESKKLSISLLVMLLIVLRGIRKAKVPLSVGVFNTIGFLVPEPGPLLKFVTW